MQMLPRNNANTCTLFNKRIQRNKNQSDRRIERKASTGQDDQVCLKESLSVSKVFSPSFLLSRNIIPTRNGCKSNRIREREKEYRRNGHRHK